MNTSLDYSAGLGAHQDEFLDRSLSAQPCGATIDCWKSEAEYLTTDFHDRRAPRSTAAGEPGRAPAAGFERRQFSNSHEGLSPEAREVAQAIDRYKLTHRRRFITCDEILSVFKSLGYNRALS
jgi:hypothetical protein